MITHFDLETAEMLQDWVEELLKALNDGDDGLNAAPRGGKFSPRKLMLRLDVTKCSTDCLADDTGDDSPDETEPPEEPEEFAEDEEPTEEPEDDLIPFEKEEIEPAIQRIKALLTPAVKEEFGLDAYYGGGMAGSGVLNIKVEFVVPSAEKIEISKAELQAGRGKPGTEVVVKTKTGVLTCTIIAARRTKYLVLLDGVERLVLYKHCLPKHEAAEKAQEEIHGEQYEEECEEDNEEPELDEDA